MSRLIDSDVLRELFAETISAIANRPEMDGNLEYMIRSSAMAIKMIDDQPTVDAVPVVRCKDCKYAYMTDDGYCNWCDIMADLLGLEYDDIHLPGDWFCADGKKVMDNEQTN